MPWRKLLQKHKMDLRHALRVALAAAVSFSLATAFDLPQGYWAVITAIVVVQTSIGGTLTASRDRLIGTGVGAATGALIALVTPTTPLATATALAVAVGATGLGASIKPSLKMAPVTAVIMIIGSASSQHGFAEAAGLRIAEIAVGGIIGVAITLLVFPARARDAVSASAQQTLADMSRVLTLYAQRLGGEEVEDAIAPIQARLRSRLGKMETQVAEATRETAARLSGASGADAIPRTLWRLRSDVVMIGRASSHRWTGPVAERLGGPAAKLLRSQAALLDGLGRSLADGSATPKPELAESFAAFREAFNRLEAEIPPGMLTFERLEQIFGLAFALEAFNQNVADLAERIAEFTGAHAD
jgi:uncharacterized membrane protein YccC